MIQYVATETPLFIVDSRSELNEMRKITCTG